MLVKLEFDSEKEGDMEEYRSMLKHRDYFCAIWDFKQELRKIWKYEDLSGKCPEELVDRIYSLLHDSLSNNSVSEDF